MVEQSNVLRILTPKHVHLLPTIFFQFHLKRLGYECATIGGIFQKRLKIEVNVTTEC